MEIFSRVNYNVPHALQFSVEYTSCRVASLRSVAAYLVLLTNQGSAPAANSFGAGAEP